MSFMMRFDTRNAAFEEGNAAYETARILRDVADQIEAGQERGGAVDVNGNRVGFFQLDTEEDILDRTR